MLHTTFPGLRGPVNLKPAQIGLITSSCSADSVSVVEEIELKEVFQVYLNTFKIAVTHLLLILFCNN